MLPGVSCGVTLSQETVKPALAALQRSAHKFRVISDSRGDGTDNLSHKRPRHVWDAGHAHPQVGVGAPETGAPEPSRGPGPAHQAFPETVHILGPTKPPVDVNDAILKVNRHGVADKAGKDGQETIVQGVIPIRGHRVRHEAVSDT